MATKKRLVERIVRFSKELGREVAKADEARKILVLVPPKNGKADG